MAAITVDDILALNPCSPYTRDVLEQLFAGNNVVDVHYVLSQDAPAGDKLMVVLGTELLNTQAKENLRQAFLGLIDPAHYTYALAAERNCLDVACYVQIYYKKIGQSQAQAAEDMLAQVEVVVGYSGT